MTATTGAPRPILGWSDRTIRVIRRVAVAWALAALAALVLSTELDLLAFRPGGDAYVIREQQAFGIGFAVAVALAWRWDVVGGTLAAMTAAALLVFARQQLEPLNAAIVVVAFAVPGALWVLVDLHDLRPRTAALAAGLIAAAVVVGGAVASTAYDDLFGPSHPDSALAALPAGPVDWVLVGGVTDGGATLTARVARGAADVRLAIAPDPALADPRWVEPLRVDGDGIARFVIDGLTAGTTYHYAVEVGGALDRVRAGRFATFPSGPASFAIAVGSCARVGSNGAVWDAIRERDPALFLVTGDLHYANIAENDPGKFRRVFDFDLSQPAPSALFRSTAIAYVWDDHDYGANNADATTPSRPAAMAVYRQYVPHYPLGGDDAPIFQAFTIGRVRVIMTDTRSARSPASAPDDAEKTMLGAEQRAWLEAELRAANGVYPVIIWANSVPWIAPAAPGGDDWGGYTTERRAIADFIAAEGIRGLLMVSGDAHMVALDDGTHSDFSTVGAGGFPVLHAAALDRPGHAKGGPYSHGAYPGGGQYGLVEIDDPGGDAVTVTLSGWTWDGTRLVSYRYTVDAGPAPEGDGIVPILGAGSPGVRQPGSGRAATAPPAAPSP